MDTAFASVVESLLADLHPGRQRVMRIWVYEHETGEPLDAAADAYNFAQVLKLNYEEVRRFVPVSREEARCACVNVAEHDLVMGDRQMPRETAERLADVWLRQFDSEAKFLINGRGILKSPIRHEDAADLFFTDFNAGVIAVSSVTVGLFWNAENS
ncbi:MAG: hypothetical protein U0359_29860 [Byssovorax sp.]